MSVSTVEGLAGDACIFVNDAVQLQTLQGILDFNKELVPAKFKTVVDSHALVKLQTGFLAPIEDILVEPGFNLRVPGDSLDAHIRAIADSIKTEGFYEDSPLAVYPAMRDKKAVFIVTNGHCRLAAAQLAISEGANISELPIIVKGKETTMEDMIVAFVKTSEGRRLAPYEIAIACKRLRGFNVSCDVIASRLGITLEYVSQLLQLAGAPYAIRAMIEKGEVTAAVAISALRSHGEEATAVLSGALEVAKAAGKSRVTGKFMPQQIRKVELRKNAPKMFEALEQVRSSKLYADLPQDTRDLIDEVFKGMSEITDTALAA